jgi:hypothetical protein
LVNSGAQSEIKWSPLMVKAGKRRVPVSRTTLTGLLPVRHDLGTAPFTLPAPQNTLAAVGKNLRTVLTILVADRSALCAAPSTSGTEGKTLAKALRTLGTDRSACCTMQYVLFAGKLGGG